ncbi:MAG: hypothetical protein GFH27_549361n70 [Chloroflexi bacterium AL-W]|nr:hypothetical protein [Chloroflexi bacterium AL-N1]NOK70782.1 hypothetical protein [Chloroflexi bacterium AL-N10]NOK78342.1 hypothetical protein [Chloroflexi bacterium AL-N5]NOK85685.1 hypothetical protein [Chloroflexi bacterium AL-W]NOK92599.1 hypothetical protein [Chloroflexi bacterium AL-N15]
MGTPDAPDWRSATGVDGVTDAHVAALRHAGPTDPAALRESGTAAAVAAARHHAPGTGTPARPWDCAGRPDPRPLVATGLSPPGVGGAKRPDPRTRPRGDSTAAQIAVACARAAQTAPADAPFRPTPALVQQLREQLPAPLRAQVDAALTAPLPTVAAPRTVADGRQTRRVLDRAVRRQHAVTLTYDTGSQGQWSQREVRPVALEQQGHHWYLRAWCTARQDERVFRLDRIGAVVQRE